MNAIKLPRPTRDGRAMLCAIACNPIVSTDTLRPDHLCAAFISEADRLGVELPRDLRQPAAAIVAHGQYGGICLSLPARLEEIAGDVVTELIDALNWAAPSGCYLGTSEGDGACFMWHVDLSAQVEAINTDPDSRIDAVVLEIPAHWLSAIVNADESSFDYYDDPADYNAYRQFCDEQLSDGWYVAEVADESSFSAHHDALPYGALPCDAVECLVMRSRAM